MSTEEPPAMSSDRKEKDPVASGETPVPDTVQNEGNPERSKGHSDVKADIETEVNVVRNPVLRGILLVAGFIFTGLGLIGIFLPLLPTTPFLLLAAACFSKSSEKFYNWLLNNKWFGSYIRNYREGKGVSLRAKASAISLMWITITLSAIYFVDGLYVRMILFIIATGVTVHLVRLPTLKK